MNKGGFNGGCKKVIVTQEPVVNAGPGLSFLYCCLCFCFAGNFFGLLGEGAGLAIGVLSLSVFVGYTVGAMSMLKSGVGIGGNTFFILAALFSGMGGFMAIGEAIATANGIPFSGKVGSLVLLKH